MKIAGFPTKIPAPLQMATRLGARKIFQIHLSPGNQKQMQPKTNSKASLLRTRACVAVAARGSDLTPLAENGELVGKRRGLRRDYGRPNRGSVGKRQGSFGSPEVLCWSGGELVKRHDPGLSCSSSWRGRPRGQKEHFSQGLIFSFVVILSQCGRNTKQCVGSFRSANYNHGRRPRAARRSGSPVGCRETANHHAHE